MVRSHVVRIVAELAPDKRPMSMAQAMWLSTMAKVGLVRDLLDIKWVDTRTEVSMKGALFGQRVTVVLLATHSQGSTWWIDEDVLNKLKAEIDKLHVITLLEGRVMPSPRFASHGSVWTVALLYDQRES